MTGNYPSFIYIPITDYHGQDSFGFHVNDGQLDSNLAVISLKITAINDTPVAFSSTINTTEEAPVVFTLSANDPDGDTLLYTVKQNPVHGVLEGSAPLLTYTPNKDYSGADTITFTVSDATKTSETATVTFTIAAINDSPIVDNLDLITPEDTPLEITLRGRDGDSDPLTYQIVAPALHGSVAKIGDQYIYTPNINFHGADSFSYKANDGTSDSNTGLVSISVTSLNDSPIAISKTVTTPIFSELSFGLDASDIDNDPLDWIIVSKPSKGSLSISGADIRYISKPGFTGVDAFTFQVDDSFAKSNIATITINVGSDSNSPEAISEHFFINENETLSIVTSGSDIDNDPLTFKLFASPTHGVLTGKPPNLTYTPNHGFVGNDRFTFASNDGTSDSTAGFITITVQSINDAPLAIDGVGSTTEDTELSITLDAFDQEGDALYWSISRDPQHGTLAGIPPKLSYIPHSDYSGTDEFSFTVNDGALDSKPGVYGITITPSNDQPIALAQSLVVNEDESIDITLSGTDKEQNTLSYTLVSSPSMGHISGTSPNIVYTPQQSFSGADSFTFRVNDGTSDSEPATVVITVSPVNDAPIAAPQSVNLDEDSSANIGLSATDTEGDSLKFRITRNPTNGALSGSVDNWVYTPNPNYSGADNFEFTANDGELTSLAATVTLNILDINDAPTATNAQYSTGQSQSLTMVLEGSDPENTPLNITVTKKPEHGEINGEEPNVVYTPEADYEGKDSFLFTVNDGEQSSVPATVNITVLADTNTAPVADAGDDSTTPLNIPLMLSGENSSDDDNDTLSFRWTINSTPIDSYATLSSYESEKSIFTPDVTGIYEVGLVVNDGQTDSNEDNITITVTDPNKRPIADAGSNRTIKPGQVITLSGSNSYDPEREELTFKWQISHQPDNSNTQLSSHISIEPLFQADTLGDYTLALIVNDGVVDSIADEVIITLSNATQVNHKPTAVAQYTIGIDDLEEYFITLDASHSSDPDGDILYYHWSLLSQHQDYDSIPGSESASLVWPTAPNNQKIQLVVNDGLLDSDPVIIEIPETASMTPMVLFDKEARSVNVGDEVYLEVDAWDDDSDITFSWRLISQPDTSLATIDEPNSQFTFFTVDTSGQYEVEITVSDGSPSGVVTHKVSIFANAPGNTAPVLIINNVADVILGQTSSVVELDASNSRDVDGNTLAYIWKLTTPDLSKAKLNDAFSPTPKFQVDLPGEYNVELFLNDGYTQVEGDISIHVLRDTNTPPVALAGIDQTASTEASITLDGSGSYDDDGDRLTFNWRLLSQPVGSSVDFNAVNSALQKPLFNPSKAGEYVFSLFVSDWTAMSNTDTVTIIVVEANQAPRANTGQASGSSIIVTTLDSVQLDGSKSTDPENSPLNYLWAIDTAPDGSSALLVNKSTVSPVLTPDLQGRYRLKLKVNDGELDSQYAFYSIRAYNTNNQAPIAIAEDPITDFIDTVVYLDGSAAYDPDGDEISSRRWQTLVGPSGANVTIAPPYGEKPFFQANLPGFYLIGYAVGDGQLTSDTVYQRINLIGPTPPEANAGSNKTGTVGRQLTFDGGNSSDADGDTLIFNWSVLTQPASSHYTLFDSDKRLMGLSADVAGDYLIQLEVTDGYTTDTDTVSLLLQANKAPTANIDVSIGTEPYSQGEFIELDASSSTDPEADRLNFSWKILEQPAGQPTVIFPGKGKRYQVASFRPYKVGNYKIQLIANDGEWDSAKVTKTITVIERNNLPIASATAPTQVSRGKPFTLDAINSFDDENDPLSYQWSILSSPENSQPSLVGANSVQTDFTPDMVGEYQIQLVVNDGENDSLPLLLTITSVDNNKQPEAYASYSHAVIVDDKVSVSGWASDDEDKDPLSYFWQMTQRPATSQATIDNDTIMAPTFTADLAGNYMFKLIVNDGLVNSEPHSITITAVVDNVGLPDHPREVGKQTLLGVDEDNDGVRDDVQRHIFATYPTDSQQNLRLALSEMAKTYQTILWEAMDPNQAYGNAITMGFHQECLSYLVDDDSYSITTKLQSEVINTMDRFEAYLAYDTSLDGEIFPTSQREDFKNSCAFQLN